MFSFWQDDSGEISFVEYITLLSCINRGNSEEQLELLFKLYDAVCNSHVQKMVSHLTEGPRMVMAQ